MAKHFSNQQKIKDEQINFLLGDLEKNLEHYRESLENKEKQLVEAKRILIAAKQGFDKVSKENRDLKAYIEQLKSQFNQQNQRQQLEFLKQQKSRPKKYKKVVLEEESENESESESENDTSLEPEEIEEEPQVKKPKRKNKKSSSNVFEYINKNAKRHKR